MASRAVTKFKPDWNKLMSQVHPNNLPKINKLKSRTDSIAIKVNSLPESLPKIDWSFYKAHASNPKIVDEIEKNYNAIKVDVPKAPASRMADLQEAKTQLEDRFKKFCVVAESYIVSSEEVKKKFEDMIPVKDMYEEDWSLTFPHWSNHSIENPSLGFHFGRAAGLTREEAAAFEQPDPVPYSTKTAWKDWEERKKKYYS